MKTRIEYKEVLILDDGSETVLDSYYRESEFIPAHYMYTEYSLEDFSTNGLLPN